MYAEQVVELATARERNRVARDIHDSLGHYLTVINVQLEKAQALRLKKPQEADQAVSDARRLAREALQDVRRSVGMLRTEQEAFSCVDAVTTLVEQVRTSQLVIDLRIEGQEAGFSKQVLTILYRAVQEGLTNVQKHAGKAHVLVEILFEARCARLRVSDDGCGFEPSSMQDVQSGHEGGYGLQGIQERLSQVGGLLSVESHPGVGTTLFVRVPKDPMAHNLPLSHRVQKE